jgi:molybdopterin molybdotransferase
MNPQGGVELFANQGSAALESTVWANGLVDIPAETVIARGEAVRFLPYGDLLH